MKNRTILAIDPGNEESGYVVYGGGEVLEHFIAPNEQMLDIISFTNADHMAVEMIASYGMSVGKDVFQTCVWIGRFIEAWHRWTESEYSLVYRKDVKMHLCGTPRAKDANIRQALIDRFGPGKDKAVGTKKNPGPLYGVRKHEWAALGVAVTHYDQARLEQMGNMTLLTLEPHNREDGR